MLSRSVPLLGFLLLALTYRSSAAADEPPLHQQIDDLLQEAAIGPVAGPADEATFLRRLTLDLIGRIPTRDEIVAYLDSDAADRRQQKIDQLLASDEHHRHMAAVFDLMLMERRGGKHVKSAEFRDYLAEAMAENRSWQAIVSEILAADGTEENNRAAAAFYLEREVAPHLLTRDVGRIFFGIDLQCAQCHNHPLIDDYHQEDYYGLQAFFLRSRLFQADKKKPALVAEQATGEASFQSVFTSREGQIGPRMPGGDELVAVTLKPAEQYQVAPAKNVREIPTLSRRQQLADLIADAPPASFERNITNRIWAHMFGRGLIEPVDLAHSGNPPAHPQVLSLLARRFAAAGHDVRWLIRELALTRAYQRSFRLPELQPSIENARQQIEAATARAEEAQQQSYQADSDVDQSLEALDAAVAQARPLRDAEVTALKQLADATKAHDEAKAKLTGSQQELAALQTRQQRLQTAVTATQAAAETLKEDQELAAALVTIQKRSDTCTEQLKKQQHVVADGEAALAQALQAQQATTVAADEAIAARIPLEDKVRTLRSQLLTHRERAQARRTDATLARRNAEYLQTLVRLNESQQQIDRLQPLLPRQTAELAALDEPLAEAGTALAQMQSELETAQANMTAGQQRLDSVAATLTSRQQTRRELLEAIARTDAAASQLAQSDALRLANTQLKESLGGLDQSITLAQTAVTAEQTAMNTLQQSLSAAESAHSQAQQARDSLQQQAESLQKQIAANQQALESAQAEQDTAGEALITKSTARGDLFGLTALTAEQLAMSMLVASGQYERLHTTAQAKVDKDQPLTDETAQDPAAVASHQLAIDQAFAASLQGPISTFVKLYASAAGQPQQEFFATVEQSLFAANGNDLMSWLQPRDGNLTERLIACETAEPLARDLYLSILSRPPTTTEVGDVADYLSARPDQKPQAVQELAWGLLTSVEFRFQH